MNELYRSNAEEEEKTKAPPSDNLVRVEYARASIALCAVLGAVVLGVTNKGMGEASALALGAAIGGYFGVSTTRN